MKSKMIVLFGVVLLVTIPLFAPTAVESYLRIEGIDGESKDSVHLGWIELQSFSFGLPQTSGGANTIGGTTGAAGRAQLSEITITKVVDKSSATLFNAALTGKHFKSAILDAHGQRFLFEDITISSVQKQAMGDGAAREVVKLNFARDVTHGSPADQNPTAKDKVGIKVDYLKTVANATMGGGGGAGSPVLLQSIRFVGAPSPTAAGQKQTPGQNQALIIVCDVGTNQVLIGLQRAYQSRQKLPALTFVALSGNSTMEHKEYLHFTFSDVLISSFSQAPGGCSQMSLNFTRFDGPLTGYQYTVK